jgi:hypothetical protein
MTENDKNDLKVPCCDSLNKTLSRDTKIKVWTQDVKCESLSRFDMKGTALFQTLYNTKPGKTSPMLHFARVKKFAKVASVKDGAGQLRGRVVQDTGVVASVSYSRLQRVRKCHH